MLYFLILKVGKHNIGRVKRIEKIKRKKKIEKIEKVRIVEKVIIKIK